MDRLAKLGVRFQHCYSTPICTTSRVMLMTGQYNFRNYTHTSISSRWNDQIIRGGKGGMKDMGTHVPLIAYWKGQTPTGSELPDLVDFTDFYPTLAEAAGIKLDQ